MTAVLIVDDDAQVQVAFRRILEGAGSEVSEADSGEVALAMLGNGYQPGVVLLDYQMPDQCGDEVLRRIRAEHPDIPVVMCSGEMTEELGQRLTAEGAAACLEKPAANERLVSLIEELSEECAG
ncbi:response regulator [Myxococcota bacterium]